MAIDVELQDEFGGQLERLVDTLNTLHRILPEPTDTRCPFASTIDWNGDTVFNRAQAGRLRKEWAMLIEETADAADRDFLWQVDRLLEKCVASVHTYVKFIGD